MNQWRCEHFQHLKMTSEPSFCERYRYQCSCFNWLKNYNLKCKFMIFSPVANLMHHPLHYTLKEECKGSLSITWVIFTTILSFFIYVPDSPNENREVFVYDHFVVDNSCLKFIIKFKRKKYFFLPLFNATSQKKTCWTENMLA